MTLAAASLTSEQAARKLAEARANELPTADTLHWYTALRRQLIDPVMGVLLAALGLTLAIGDWPDAAVIGLVIVLNSTLGTRPGPPLGPGGRCARRPDRAARDGGA